MISAPVTQSDPASMPLGSLVGGRYETQRLLGEGGFGAVFSAVDRQTGGAVALKVISSAVLEMSGGKERFRREVDVVKRLSHPNIVRVVDSGLDDAGTLYIAFELLDGHSLEAELEKRGGMQAKRVAALSIQLLDALDVAHNAGVIHRDIKPANVFLVGPTSEHAKLLDFGIAKSTNPNSLQGLTKAGMMLGTPAYMAPEQLFGKPVTPTSDLFALGIVMAEMIVGRALYPDDVSPVSILQERISLGRVPVPEVVQRTPLFEVIARAVAMEPAHRFQSAREMRAAVESAAARLVHMSFTPHGGTVPVTTPSAAPVFAASSPNATVVPGYGGPPAPWSPPVAPTTRRRSEAGLIAVVALIVALACIGVAAGIYFAVYSDDSGSRRPKKKKSETRTRSDERDEPRAPPGPSLKPLPTPTIPTATIPTPGGAVPNVPAAAPPVFLSCPQADSLSAPKLRSILVDAGLPIRGEQLYCAGDMINMRCMGPEGTGFTVDVGGGVEGGAVVMKNLGTSADAFAHKDAATARSALTHAYGAQRSLRLEMPAATAKRVTDRVCK